MTTKPDPELRAPGSTPLVHETNTSALLRTRRAAPSRHARSRLRAGVRFFVAVVALAVFLTACGGDDDETGGTGNSEELPAGLSNDGTPVRGGTLVYAWNFLPADTLDPIGPTAVSIGHINLILSIFDRLVDIKPGSLDIRPGLAESWDVSEDGREYTFTLRDAQFSNGEKVTAEDVKFSLERFADPKENVNYPTLGAAISRVEVEGPNQVKVTLKYSQGAFLDYMAHVTASIVPRKLFEELGAKKFGKEPIGSGPFAFKRIVGEQSVELTRNPRYWREGKPYLDGVRFVFLKDDNTRILKVISGEADVANPVPYSQVESLRRRPTFRVQVEPIGGVSFVAINNQKPPLDDRNVRLALNYATPRAALRKSVFADSVELANAQVPKLKLNDSSVESIPYDIDKAKQLLAKSANPSGFKASLVTIGSDADSRRIATILQDAWSKLGVKLTIEQVDGATWGDRAVKYDYDMLMAPPDAFTADNGVEDQTAAFLLTPTAYYNYKDPRVASLVKRMDRSADTEERKRLYAELQRYTLTENPAYIPLVFPTSRTLVADRVQGLRTLFNGWWHLEDAWLKD